MNVGSTILRNNGATGPSTQSTKSSEKKQSEINREDFLQLLMTQLRYQNPLDPIKDADFAAQLSQFSTLDEMEKLNGNFSNLLMLQGLSQGANLIGKAVAFRDDSATSQGSQGSGIVESVKIEKGRIQLVIGDKQVSMEQVSSISQ